MVESLRPLTLLLGGAALWALCLLVLALGGLGTRFPAPEESIAPPPVPIVSLKPTVSRLGAFDTYAEVGARPVMNVGRKPAAVAAVDDATGGGDLDVTLTSVMITSRLKLAILTDNKDSSSKRVRLGELVEGSGGWRLVALEPRHAVLEGPSGQRSLDLRVYDGASGEAPTPVAAANPPGGEPGAPPPPPAASPTPPAQPVQPKPAVAQNARPAPTTNAPDPNAMTQEEQVEAIRRRIEARRAQMRAEAESAAATNR